MTREEAKSILSIYRPAHSDAESPQVRQALALAQADPALGRWFVNEQELDAAIGAKLRSYPVSPELRDRLISSRKIVRPGVWWNTTSILATLAGAILAVACLLWYSLGQIGDSTQNDLRMLVADASLNRKSHVQAEGLSPADLRRWIREHGGTAEFAVPPGLAAMPIAGCKVMHWNEKTITLICFAVGHRHYDLFVVAEPPRGTRVYSRPPRFSSLKGLVAASWQTEGKHYFLTGRPPQSAIKQLF